MSIAKPASFRLLLIVAAVIAALFGVVGWGLMTGLLADTKALPGNKLMPRIAQTVSVSAALAPGERILYFYSTAMTPEGDGNLLTDKRVISYVDDGTGTRRSSIAIDDIESVDFFKNDGWLEDSTIIVTSSDGTELTLYVSNDGGGDARFVDAILRAAKLDDGSHRLQGH